MSFKDVGHFNSINELKNVCVLGEDVKRVCYYTNWSQYRPADGRFTAKDVDPTLCSHIIYAYAKLVGNQISPTEWNDESDTWTKGKWVHSKTKGRKSALLTHHPLDKMADISQTTFSNAFSWMIFFVFWLEFHPSLFLKVQLTINQHWFRWWLGAIIWTMPTWFTDAYLRH